MKLPTIKINFVSIIKIIKAIRKYLRNQKLNTMKKLFLMLMLFGSISCIAATIPTGLTTYDPYNVDCTYFGSGSADFSDGGSTIIEKGICWGTSHNPTKDYPNQSFHIHTGGASNFGIGLAGANQSATTYYVKTYAINSIGIAYGPEKSFTTKSNPSGLTTISPTILSCTSVQTGSIAFSADVEIVSKGVCYGTSVNPDETGNKVDYCSYPCNDDAFTVTINNLTPNTLYHFRSYIDATYCGTFYGPDVQCTTPLGPATITTNPNLCALTAFSACVQGNVTAQNCSNVTTRGVCWNTSGNPTISGNHSHTGSGTGTFNGPMTSLNSSTKYYVKAFATNTQGTSYGNEISFTTLSFP
jgi:hypothetical protein